MTTPDDLDIRVQRIDGPQTHALRHAVLRPHQTLSEMVYDGDCHADTIHLGAFVGRETTPVGVVTLNPTPMPGSPSEGDWRLRGMAVAEAAQGTGVGRRLVEHALIEVAKRNGKRLWCNARVTARGFYEKLGFAAHGDVFEIVPIGPHYVMSADTRDRNR
ncbi:MAG: GNAT family N-acetyltransferase [Phycisphaeraceae bacterium]